MHLMENIFPLKIKKEVDKASKRFKETFDKEKFLETNVKVKEYKNRIKNSIAELCEISSSQINIKGKTADKIGIFGKSEAIGCWATINLIN